MTVEDRKRMDFLLQLGWTPAQIAEDRGRSKSTILHETINRSVPCDRGYRRSNRICARFDACPRIRGYGKDAKRSFNRTPRRFEVCPDFVEQGCGRLDVPSRVCNGCRDFKSCPVMKRLYVADGAQANRESLLHDSRSGVHPDAEALARMNAVLSPCITRGQSVRNVAANNPETSGSVKERTVYDYIAGGLFDAKRGDLPEACSRKPGKKRKETGTNAKCRAGRDYRTFLEFCRVNEMKEWTELDTVVGRVGGKVLFTMILPGGPMLMFLRDRKSSQTCTRVFNMLWDLAGPELSRRLFSVILTDNGTEFSDPDMIENWRPDPGHNPTRLLWRGIHLFYCDAYCSSQKPHVEREHREERRVLLHGVSFDAQQDDVNLVASYSRGVLDNQMPYDAFVGRFGEPGKKSSWTRSASSRSPRTRSRSTRSSSARSSSAARTGRSSGRRASSLQRTPEGGSETASLQGRQPRPTPGFCRKHTPGAGGGSIVPYSRPIVPESADSAQIAGANAPESA